MQEKLHLNFCCQTYYTNHKGGYALYGAYLHAPSLCVGSSFHLNVSPLLMLDFHYLNFHTYVSSYVIKDLPEIINLVHNLKKVIVVWYSNHVLQDPCYLYESTVTVIVVRTFCNSWRQTKRDTKHMMCIKLMCIDP